MSKTPPGKNTKPLASNAVRPSDGAADTVARAAPSERFDHKSFLANCSRRAGVYQMFDAEGEHLYIGKAKNLKNRLTSYFRSEQASVKTAVMVRKIAHIDVTVTRTETEALILERNLINAERPPYNVLFRDDKSYPYIYLSEHKYPRIAFYRGSKRERGRYFGPFPSSQAVRESLNLLQKVFKVRQCEDSFYNNRSRPCLQHQIGRCTAPCVGLISTEDYDKTVRQSVMFLEGKDDELGSELTFSMERASAKQAYEDAALYRDQITHLRRVQENQYVEGNRGDIDVLAAAIDAGHGCVQALYVRRGRMLGSRSFYPKPGLAESPGDLLEAFIGHSYLGNGGSLGGVPGEIIINCELPSPDALAAALSNSAGKQVAIVHKVRAGRARWQRMASETASQNLSARLHSRQQIEQRFEELRQDLELEATPGRIECFDISHSSGEQTVASCVVFDREGAKKSDYRKFNIEGITGGDDYAAMRQALSRRYQRLTRGEASLPDILLIDGGKGQMTQAREVFDALGVQGVLIIGIAKGATRKPGFETLFVGSHDNVIRLPADAGSLHLVQQIRDEAHRFAITGHRARRARARNNSPLEGIAGIGPKRRQQLLKHFGGWQEIDRASVEDLAKVPGISKKIAEDVYAALHSA
ncbi:MAG: excinuclease ABC subunit UvrC [Pseudomonadales bacterium]